MGDDTANSDDGPSFLTALVAGGLAGTSVDVAAYGWAYDAELIFFEVTDDPLRFSVQREGVFGQVNARSRKHAHHEPDHYR